MKAVSSLAATVLLFAVVSAGCDSPTTPTDPLTVTLAPGQSADYGPLSVKFIEVTDDSRCPGNALCIQQGDATFAVEAKVGLNTDTYELKINDAAKRSVVHAGFVITASELGPYPFTIDLIPPGDYRLTLVIDEE